MKNGHNLDTVTKFVEWNDFYCWCVWAIYWCTWILFFRFIL